MVLAHAMYGAQKHLMRRRKSEVQNKLPLLRPEPALPAQSLQLVRLLPRRLRVLWLNHPASAEHGGGVWKKEEKRKSYIFDFFTKLETQRCETTDIATPARVFFSIRGQISAQRERRFPYKMLLISCEARQFQKNEEEKKCSKILTVAVLLAVVRGLLQEDQLPPLDVPRAAAADHRVRPRRLVRRRRRLVRRGVREELENLNVKFDAFVMECV